MCNQLDVLNKIREKGHVNGHGVELAEAQMRDYIAMNKKVTKIEKDVSYIRKEQIKQGETLAELVGQMKLVVSRMNSPVDEERKNGIIWAELKSIMKTSMGKIIVLLLVGCIGLAGQRILELLGVLPQ